MCCVIRKPAVVMIVGVNGGGKTTSLGKSRIELLIFGFELNFGIEGELFNELSEYLPKPVR